MASLHLAQEIFKLIYPVGSIYMSVNNTNPGTLFGGTWSQVAKGQCIVGVNANDTDFNSAMKTGGSKTKNMTHSHELWSRGIAYIGAPSGNATGIGYVGWSNGNGPDSIYSVGGNSHNAAGHPKRSHNTRLGGSTDDAMSSTFNIMPPYYTCYIWRRTA